MQINCTWCTIGIFVTFLLQCWASSVEGRLRQRLACSRFAEGAWCGVAMGSRFWWVGGFKEGKIITKQQCTARGMKGKAMVHSCWKQRGNICSNFWCSYDLPFSFLSVGRILWWWVADSPCTGGHCHSYTITSSCLFNSSCVEQAWMEQPEDQMVLLFGTFGGSVIPLD